MSFYCETCKSILKTEIKLDKHNKTRTHLKKLNGIKRDMSNSTKTEKSVGIYLKEKMEKKEFILLPNLGLCKIIEIMKSKKGSKSDTLFKILNKDNKEEIIGIQTKQDDFNTVSNWINISQMNEEEKEIFKGMCYNEENLNMWELQLKKERKANRKKKNGGKNNKITNICLNIGVKKTQNEVINFEYKEKYLRGIESKRDCDHFLYNIQKKDTDFDTNKLKYVDKDFINNMKLYYQDRLVYDNSGDTQSRHKGIMNIDKDYQKVLDEINSRK